MNFEAYVANGKLIASDNKFINDRPEELLIRVSCGSGVWLVRGSIEGNDISNIDIENVCDIVTQAKATKRELELYKREINNYINAELALHARESEKLRKNLRELDEMI